MNVYLKQKEVFAAFFLFLFDKNLFRNTKIRSTSKKKN